MNVTRIVNYTAAFLVLCTSMMAVGTLAAQAAEPAQGFAAFKLLRTRNVFDPDRRATRTETSSSSRPQTLTSRPDFLTLTGTMVSDGKTLAFFNGSRSEYTKVISVNDKVADFTVTAIDSGIVSLDRAGKPVQLSVGKQITLDGTGTISASSPVIESRAEAPASDASATPAAAGPAAGGSSDPGDVLKRMMERRQKEMSK